MSEKIYSTVEAAAYLGLSTAVFRHHIYASKRIEPDLRLGRNLGFYQSSLDAYKAKYLSQDYTVEEAARYLDVNVHRIKKAVSAQGTLRPTGMRSKAMVFDRGALDAAKPHLMAAKSRRRREPA